MKVDGITKRFGNNEVLQGVSFKILKGDMVCVLGANGAGKSTLFNIVLDNVAQDKGEVLKTWGDKPISFCPQQDMGWDFLTIKEHLELIQSIQAASNKTPDKQMIAKIAQISDVISHIHKRFKELSGGYQRRVTIAMALLANSEIVLLDEPTTSLDMESRLKLMQQLFKMREELGTTILFTTHHLEDAETFADKILLLARGSIVLDGSIDDIRSRFNKA